MLDQQFADRVGAAGATPKLQLDIDYAISCRSRMAGGSWSPSSPVTAVRYPNLTLPVLRIDTAGSAPIVSRQDYLAGSVSVDPNGRSGVPALAATAKIRGRGNSTWTAPTDKKPSTVKLDTAVPLLGLPSNKNWALLANYYDRIMLRNTLADGWGQASSLSWTPRRAYAELVLNGNDRGVYQISQTPDVSPDRVAIDAMKSGDTVGTALTGGYLAEIDYKAGTPYGQPDDVTNVHAALVGTPVTIKDPDPSTPEQIACLRGQVDTSESALLKASTGDPDAYADLGRTIDLQSYADCYVVSETARSYDSGYSSTYFSKPREGKLTMGPLWDFDLSMGTYFFTSSRPTTPGSGRGFLGSIIC